MDPAETDRLRQALSIQGAHVGNHEKAINEIMETLRDLSTGVSQLGGRLEEVVTTVSRMASPATPPAPPPAPVDHSVPPPTLSRKTFIPTPARYSGELGTCGQFLHQCTLVFEQQPLTYATDKSKIAFIMSLLSDRASSWALAVSSSTSTVTQFYPSFVSEMRKVFDHPVQGREASSRLLTLHQGSAAPVAQYAIDFRILAAESGWDDAALQSVFLRGLADNVKDELAARDETRSFDELISLATRLDNRLRESRRERAGRQGLPQPSYRTYATTSSRFSPLEGPAPRGAAPASTSGSPSTLCSEEPMQIGGMRLSPAERQRRFRLRLCIYCGQPGHVLVSCPQLPKEPAHQPPEGRW